MPLKELVAWAKSSETQWAKESDPKRFVEMMVADLRHLPFSAVISAYDDAIDLVDFVTDDGPAWDVAMLAMSAAKTVHDQMLSDLHKTAAAAAITFYSIH